MNQNPEDFEELVLAASEVVQEIDEKTWEKADIAQEAAEQYGRLKELCKRISQDYGYWKKLSYVASRYDKVTRSNFSNLSFKHFEVVVKQSNRIELLELAQKENWSASRLQRELHPKVDKMEELAQKVAVKPPEEDVEQPDDNLANGNVDYDNLAEPVETDNVYVKDNVLRLSYEEMADALQWYWNNNREELLKNEKVVDVIRMIFQEEREIVFDANEGFSLVTSGAIINT